MIKFSDLTIEAWTALSEYEVPSNILELIPGHTLVWTPIDKFYYIDLDYMVKSADASDFTPENLNILIQLGSCIQVRTRAEAWAEYLAALNVIYRWKETNDNVLLDWKDSSQRKYYLVFDTRINIFRVEFVWNQPSAGTIYFSSRRKAQECLNKVGSLLLPIVLYDI